MKKLLASAAFVVAAATVSVAQQPAIHVRGQIAGLEGSVITVNQAGGPIKIKLNEGYRVNLVVKAALATIVPGMYVGTAALPQPDGTLLAQEVLIFPEALKGSGEGHRPWDLTAKSTMTNATVEAVAPLLVDRIDHRVLTLRYADGEKRVLVPPNVPIVTFVPGEKSELVAGAHVFVSATKHDDGSFSASGVNVGKDGLVPPM